MFTKQLCNWIEKADLLGFWAHSFTKYWIALTYTILCHRKYISYTWSRINVLCMSKYHWMKHSLEMFVTVILTAETINYKFIDGNILKKSVYLKNIQWNIVKLYALSWCRPWGLSYSMYCLCFCDVDYCDILYLLPDPSRVFID